MTVALTSSKLEGDLEVDVGLRAKRNSGKDY